MCGARAPHFRARPPVCFRGCYAAVRYAAVHHEAVRHEGRGPAAPTRKLRWQEATFVECCQLYVQIALLASARSPLPCPGPFPAACRPVRSGEAAARQGTGRLRFPLAQGGSRAIRYRRTRCHPSRSGRTRVRRHPYYELRDGLRYGSRMVTRSGLPQLRPVFVV
jgi:hypothetical protein